MNGPGGYDDIVIVSNEVQAATNFDDNCAIWSDTVNDFNDDQFSEITQTAATAGSDWIGLTCRVASDGDSYGGYCRTASNDCEIYDVANGSTFTSLASGGSSTTNGEVGRFEVDGTTLRVLVEGVQQVSTTDTTYTTGQPGFVITEDAGTPAADDWRGGDLVTTMAADAGAYSWSGQNAELKRDATVFIPGSVRY